MLLEKKMSRVKDYETSHLRTNHPFSLLSLLPIHLLSFFNSRFDFALVVSTNEMP